MKLTFIDYLVENTGPRIPHPEDSIFDGSAETAKYVQALQDVIDNPGGVSIKWDGGIALVFGRNEQGQFFCADKYMPAKGVFPASPAQWIEYDRARGADRSTGAVNLYRAIELIWSGLEAAVTETATFKGDLMHVGRLRADRGVYKFKPVTVEYHIPVDSAIGKLVTNKVGIVVVHQKNGAPWDGTGLVNAGNVAILDPTANIKFQLKNPVQLVKAAEQAVSKYGKISDDFLAGMDGVAQKAIKQYFNHKITKQTNEELASWLQHHVSGKQFKLLVGDDQDGYLYTNHEGYVSLTAIWNSVYALKVNLAEQLERQVTGFGQWVAGKQAGEGFVVNTAHGLVKLVNRDIFGGAHFAKMQ